MPRKIYVVRHCERIDNIDSKWRKKYPGFMDDNSPLSDRGRKIQGPELCKRFANVKLDHVISSPMDRTIETASLLLGDKDIPIKAEPGLCEVLYLCNDPPSFWKTEKLIEKFPKVDKNYSPIFNKLPSETGYGDEACIPRVKKLIEQLLKRYDNPDEQILLVSHGAPIGAIHEVLNGRWKYVGQATVSIWEETDDGSEKFKCLSSSDSSHLSDKSNLRPW
uniref:Phosphoglycerate mutase n=1 Tax=Parastrongyloides trichosuri TaxID=131310 RepID=A0A0N4Z0I6_PARTI